MTPRSSSTLGDRVVDPPTQALRGAQRRPDRARVRFVNTMRTEDGPRWSIRERAQALKAVGLEE